MFKKINVPEMYTFYALHYKREHYLPKLRIPTKKRTGLLFVLRHNYREQTMNIIGRRFHGASEFFILLNNKLNV